MSPNLTIRTFQISISTDQASTATDFWIDSLRSLRASRTKKQFSLQAHTQSIIYELFGNGSDTRSCPLIKASLLVAQRMQSEALLAQEPRYHNQWHTADVLSGSAALLKAERQRSGQVVDTWEKALILSAVSHDFMHPGGVNKHPFEIEQRSLTYVRNLWLGGGLSEQETERIKQLILHTDVSTVPDNHRRINGRVFEFDLDWTTVLMNEADIAASCSPEFGPLLDQDLAQEWRDAGHWKSDHQVTSQDRQQFLKSVVFSSPASVILGWPVMVKSQLKDKPS